MPKIQTRCPNCQQPITADVQQVLDVGIDPKDKEKLLSGSLNMAQCSACGFQGQLPLPIVYHDPEEELLLTFYPPSMNKTMEEKERKIGPLLKKVTENLPPEKRKGYLFQPQTMMSMQSLVKQVLEADGITPEMIEEQQGKMDLLERLLRVSGEAQKDLIRKEAEKIDREFFAIFSQIVQRMLASQNQEVLAKVQELQDNLLEGTEAGREIARESAEIESARKTLEQLGDRLSREKLLDLVINANSNERVRAYVSLARPAMDYNFLQMFSKKVEEAEGKNRDMLVERRNLILKLTQEIDKYIEQRLETAQNNLEKMLETDSVEEGIRKFSGSIDETFLQVLSTELEKAEKAGDEKRKEKLAAILAVIQDLSTPEEYKLIDQFLEVVDDESELTSMIQENKDKINQQVVSYLANLVASLEQGIPNLKSEDKMEQEKLLEQIKKIHRLVLKLSMKKSIRQN